MSGIDKEKQLKKSFGRYRCAEVNALVSELRRYASIQEERADRLEQEVNALREQKAETEEYGLQNQEDRDFIRTLQQEYADLLKENARQRQELEKMEKILQTIRTLLPPEGSAYASDPGRENPRRSGAGYEAQNQKRGGGDKL